MTGQNWHGMRDFFWVPLMIKPARTPAQAAVSASVWECGGLGPPCTQENSQTVECARLQRSLGNRRERTLVSLFPFPHFGDGGPGGIYVIFEGDACVAE